MILVIAEKPSVAQSIAKVLGETTRKDGYMEGGNYIVSWFFGHLVELTDASSYEERYAKWRYDDLPIVPESWMFEVTKDKAQQFKVLSSLMKDKRVTELVCATDAGREGELIFRLVYDKTGCTKPFKRLWISSLEAVSYTHLDVYKRQDSLRTAKPKLERIETDILNNFKTLGVRTEPLSGYDMDIIPSDLATFGGEAKRLLQDLQTRNERLFLVTILIMNTATNRQCVITYGSMIFTSIVATSRKSFS